MMYHLLVIYLQEIKKLINYLIRQIGFGGGCINDTLIHLSSSYLGFGGFKESGLGSYHGKAGFYTFSHTKSIIDKKLWIDLPMMYSPYSKGKDRIIHKFLNSINIPLLQE